MDLSKPIPVTEGLWWVGSGGTHNNLQCNPYLLIQGGSAILFDPGSVLDFDTVAEKVSSLVPISELEAIVCSHQDPDLCSALPLFEKAGFAGPICCHKRAAAIITYYGVQNPFYPIDLHEYAYTLKDGTAITFIFAPYLHFPGAIMSYLPIQKVLVSGDLFGSVTSQWHLFAESGYEEGMKAFHEAYMPSHDILKPVMDQLEHYDIKIICPQHGSIIKTEIPYHIQLLRDLPCGIFLEPVRKNLLDVGGHLALCNQIVKRYVAMFGAKEVREALVKSPFVFNAKNKAIQSTKLAEQEIWDAFFDLIHERKGMGWITVVAPAVELMSKEYSIALPDVFRTLVFDAIRNLDTRDSKMQELESARLNLEEKLKHMEESLYKDTGTGLYNEEFHRLFIHETMATIAEGGKALTFLMISIDNLSAINLDFGSAEGNATLRNLAMVIKRHIEPTSRLFRLSGGVFGIHCMDLDKDEVIRRAETMRTTIAESDIFIVPITVSIGMFNTTEIPQSVMGDLEQMVELTMQTARYRLKLAQKQGGGMLVHASNTANVGNTIFTILLIDEPGLGRDIIRRALEQNHYRVVVADNGLEGRRFVEEERPDIIISELMIPKVSALTLRKELLARPSTRKIPFLLMSSIKNESTIGRALEVNISHFFWRPVMLVELLGIVNLIANRLQIQGN
ncbi:MAG: MBL fold metallo-hydrolase [Sphaerochaetaceae bacterium]